MHLAEVAFIKECADLLTPPYTVLEVGSLDVNGTIRHLFPGATEYIGLDIQEGPGVDIVADAAIWEPDPEHLYDVVVTAEVLEHAPHWDAILDTCYASLKPGGVLIMTCATTGRSPHDCYGSPTIPDGQYYRNVPLAEVAEWAEDKFSELELRHTCGSDLQLWGVAPDNISPCPPRTRHAPPV